MSIQVLGISGSPTKNSNTDRLINAILEKTGAESEFIKLSDMNVRPCRACYQCVSHNVCKAKDDFPELAEKIKSANALATEMKGYENRDLLGQVSASAVSWLNV